VQDVKSNRAHLPDLKVDGRLIFNLARRLRSLVDHEMGGIQTKDKLRVIHAKVQKQLEGAYQMSRQRYDNRARTRGWLNPSAPMHTRWRTSKPAVWECITPKTSGSDLKEGQNDHFCYTSRQEWDPR